MVKLIIGLLLFSSQISYAGGSGCQDILELMSDPSWTEMIKSDIGITKCVEKYHLTDLEAVNIHTYTNDGASDYNEALRGGGVNLGRMQTCINALTSAIGKMPIHQGEVWRGVALPESVDKEHQVGAIVTYKAFTSTATTVLSNYESTHALWITSKTGRDISQCTTYDEKEVLFRPGTKFLVKARMGNTIWLEEVL